MAHTEQGQTKLTRKAEQAIAALLKHPTIQVSRYLSNLKPIYYLGKGEFHVSEFKNTIHGNVQGIIGDHGHVQDLTYNEIGSRIEKSMDLTQLAAELSMLRQAMSREATEPTHYIVIGKVAEAEEAAKVEDSSRLAASLKGAGKFAMDFASKVGASLTAEAIKQSMSIQ